MASPLIKKNGYGYHYGYGYGAPIPLLPSGKKTLIGAILILVTGVLWIFLKLFIWNENRNLTASRVAWFDNEPVLALQRFQKVNKWAVSDEAYAALQATILLEHDPARALALLSELENNEKSSDWRSLEQLKRIRLEAAARSQDWKALQLEIDSFAVQASHHDVDLLVAKANQSLNQGKYEEGFQLLESALRKNPFHAQALFLKAEIQALSGDLIQRNQARVSLSRIAKTGGPEAFRAKLQLIGNSLLEPESKEWRSTVNSLEHSPYLNFHYLTHRDSVLHATLATLGEQAPSLSYKLTKNLLQQESATAQDLAKAIYFAQESGLAAEATEHLESPLANGLPRHDRLWLYARQNFIEGAHRPALERSKTGIEENGDKRLIALIAKIAEGTASSVPAEIRVDAARFLFNRSDLQASQWAFAANKLWELQPVDTQALVSKAKRYAKEKPLEIAAFLLSKNLPESCLEALQHAPPPSENVYAASLRFQALIASNQLDLAQSLLENTPAVSPMTKGTGLLMISFLRSNSEEQEQNWQDAWRAATIADTPRAYASLGDLCFEFGQDDWANSAYQAAEQKDPRLAIGQESLQRYSKLLVRQGKTKQAHDVLARALKHSPPTKGHELSNNWAYLSLLINGDVLAAKDTLNDTRDSLANTQTWARAMALALLKTGQGKSALETLRSLANHEPNSLENSTLAVYYAAASANDEDEVAESLMAKIERSKLLPEEIALIEEFTPITVEKITLPQINDDERLYQPGRS